MTTRNPSPPSCRPWEAVDAPREVRVHCTGIGIDLDAAPTNTVDAYLRLHLLSHRLVQPNSISLEGIFAVLPNVVWTKRAVRSRGLRADRARLRARGPVTV